MEKNIFLDLKAGFSVLCGAFGIAFGWMGWLIVAWTAFMCMDWMSGSIAAKVTGTWKSEVARAGIWHKVGMVFVVAVAAITDSVLCQCIGHVPGVTAEIGNILLPMILIWYIFTEAGSIMENAKKIGAPIPAPIIDFLTTGRDLVTKNWDKFGEKFKNE